MSKQVEHHEKPEAMHTRAAKGGLVSGFSFALNLGMNLVQVPLLLRFWPQETYGLWLSVAALSNLLTALDGGHQAYVGNLLNRQIVEDRALFRRTLASAVCIAMLTASVQIVLAVALCFSGKAADWLGVELAQSTDFSISVVIYTVGWISTGSIGAVLVRLFPPTGRFVRSTWWGIGMRLAQFSAVVVAAWLGWGLVATACLFAATVFAVNVVLFADIRRLYPELFPWWRGADWRAGFKNLASSGVVTVVGVLDYFSLQGVVLMVAGGLGAAVVPLFTTLRTMANMAMQGTGFLLNPIQPDLVRYHVQREGEKISAVFGFFWFATGVLINGGMLAALFMVEPVYAFWTQGRLEFDRALFGWLAAAVLVRTLAAPLQSYLTSINHLPALSITAVLRAALTVGGVMIGATRWGLAGVGGALFVAELAGSLIVPGWFVAVALARVGGRLDFFAVGLAGVSASAAGTGLTAFALGISGWQGFASAAAGVVLILSWLQWRGLPPDVRRRAGAVLPPFWRRRPLNTPQPSVFVARAP